MAEYAEALIRRTKKLSVAGICALAVGAGMLGGGTGIASADQIGADGTVTAGPSNVESETHGIVSSGSQGTTRASEAGNCSIGLSSDHTCPGVTLTLPSAGGEARQGPMAVPVVNADSPAPGDLSACLYFLAGLQNDSAWNWAGHPGC